MKKLFLMLFVGFLCISGTPLKKKSTLTEKRTSRGSVLVQLFTSQGCSSCPPADKLLGTLSEKYQGQDVYFLAYHVDYWDRLGWKDPYSQREFSQKQYNYAQAFHLPSVYTPQAVVNGTYQFTGSDSGKMQTTIAKSRRSGAGNATLTLSLPDQYVTGAFKPGIKVKINYKTDHLGQGGTINIDLYIKEAVTAVPRGENSGRKLVNCNTVISEKTAMDAEGQFTFDLPAHIEVKNLGIIGYVQKKDKHIAVVSALELH